jgi:hypothetical protein
VNHGFLLFSFGNSFRFGTTLKFASEQFSHTRFPDVGTFSVGGTQQEKLISGTFDLKIIKDTEKQSVFSVGLGENLLIVKAPKITVSSAVAV